MNSFRKFSPLMLAVLLLTGCQKTTTVEMKPTPVAVVQVVLSEEEPSQQYTGQVRPRYEINAAFRVGGKVIDRMVEVGQAIQAGTPLAQLDTLDYQLAIDAADSELQAATASEKRATAEEKRTRDLVARSMVSQSEYDLARAAADSGIASSRRAERMLEIAKNRLKYCTLTAEYDCVVTRVFCEKGSVVQEGAPAFQLARTGELEAVVDIPENRIERAKDMTGRMALWANSLESFETKLREVSPNADPVTRTYQARYSILNPSQDVRMGMTATILLHASTGLRGISIPLTSIIQSEGSPAVWIVNPTEGSLELRPIKMRLYGREQAWIESGIEPGELVVRAGVQKLDSSMKVSIWEERVAKSN